MIASGCVWSTHGAGTNACRSVSIDGRGWSGESPQRSEVVDHRRVVHLVPFAQRQHLVEPQRGKPAAVIVARSVPEPLTQSTRCSRPAWSTTVPLDEVLPPPWLASERSAPSRFERWTSASSRPAGRPPRPSGPRARGSRRARAALLMPQPPTRPGARRPAKRSRASCPGRGVLGLVDDGRERRAHDLARLRERAELAERHRLHEQVAEQRRLLRARRARAARGARRPAAEQLVVRAAADDVDLGAASRR